MKKFSAILLLLLVACTSTAEPDAAAPSIVGAPTALPSGSASEAVSKSSTSPSLAPFQPATTIEEAAVIRDQDQVIGAADPIVAILEYGDYQ